MILMIDNYDSFTYNIAQYLGELGEELTIWRNDQFRIEDVQELAPEAIVISPGPCTPDDAGLTLEVLKHYYTEYPFFGVCLGHQSIGQFFGGRVIHAERLMHGKTSEITHTGDEMFTQIESPFVATRYHSLIVEKSSFPEVLEVTALSPDGEIMALRHRELPIQSVQFHPESYCTEAGKQILRNFLDLVRSPSSV
ncbi:MAG: aminodeoxychorismate/anthranilate synthase component II [Opitutales bacterium]|nr:aminodeoxychorismate/anthranilate synthase component II [Opitutales bacterium]